MFERKELWYLIDKVRENLETVKSVEWKLALKQLLLALSTLDAFIARTEVNVVQFRD